MRLLKKGAEADIYLTTWDGSDAILKIRKPKEYRNSLLDIKLCRQRTVRESQTLSQVKMFGIPAPLIYFVNLKDHSIVMQKIPGTSVHDLPDSDIVLLSREIGRLVGILHKNGIMHGDLTTSNFLYHDGIVYVIDFGLSQKTTKPEDHAVDLRLIREILNSAHAKIMEQSWKNFLSGYGGVVGISYRDKITHLVSVIEGRGRYAKVI